MTPALVASLFNIEGGCPSMSADNENRILHKTEAGATVAQAGVIAKRFTPVPDPTPEEIEAAAAKIRAENEAKSQDTRKIDTPRLFRMPKVYRDPQMNQRNRRRR